MGKKRAFAGAIDWPGWCRSGQDQEAALEALLAYSDRYARVLQAKGLQFQEPTNASAFQVVERLQGGVSTDFGALDGAPSADARPVDAGELHLFKDLLDACWLAFDSTVRAASGIELRI